MYGEGYQNWAVNKTLEIVLQMSEKSGIVYIEHSQNCERLLEKSHQ